VTRDAELKYFPPGNLDGDGTVGVVDFLALLGFWGHCPDPCLADLDRDGDVGVLDFLHYWPTGTNPPLPAVFRLVC
jgi:hypothetical protein